MQKRHHKRQRENRCLFLRIFCRYVHTTNLYPPTGNLDSRSSEAVIDAFITAKKELEATILMVTHDSLSASYCDRVILMRDGVVSGELVRKGDRREFFNELMDVLRKLNGGE